MRFIGSATLSGLVKGLAQDLPADALRLGDAVAVEWRYIGDVVGGAIGDGLQVR